MKNTFRHPAGKDSWTTSCPRPTRLLQSVCFTQAVFFRRYGLLAAIFLRLGNYLVWHILYGNFVLGY